MSKSANATTLAAVSDFALGTVGTAIPPSETLNQSIKYFGTWAGSDKLLMTAQYAAKLLAPLLIRRAAIQHSAGLREKPSSPSADALVKLAGSISSARRVSALWCILPIFKWLSAIERAPASTPPLEKTLQRVQALSMLAFYSLELVSFFSSPTAPIIPSSVITPRASGLAQLWSIRAWAAYTVIQVGLLVKRRVALKAEKKGLQASLRSGEKDAEEVKVSIRDVKKRETANRLALVENLAFLPLTFHWSIIGGVISNELLVDGLSFVAAIAGFKAGWSNA